MRAPSTSTVFFVSGCSVICFLDQWMRLDDHAARSR